MEKLKSGAAKLGISLSPIQVAQFEIFYRELIDWNKRINLTSITGYEEVQLKHFLDSLTLAAACDFKKTITVIDVGTGAGLPGIPLKIAYPDIKLTLLEATIKKTKFLENVVSKLGLNNVEIIASRAETVGQDKQYRETFDIVLSRAVAALPALAELMLPLCKIEGTCIAQKKGEITHEVELAGKAIELLGGKLREIKPINLDELKDHRQLVIIDKVRATPEAYPRRPGMPEKRPIIP